MHNLSRSTSRSSVTSHGVVDVRHGHGVHGHSQKSHKGHGHTDNGHKEHRHKDKEHHKEHGQKDKDVKHKNRPSTFLPSGPTCRLNVPLILPRATSECSTPPMSTRKECIEVAHMASTDVILRIPTSNSSSTASTARQSVKPVVPLLNLGRLRQSSRGTTPPKHVVEAVQQTSAFSALPSYAPLEATATTPSVARQQSGQSWSDQMTGGDRAEGQRKSSSSIFENALKRAFSVDLDAAAARGDSAAPQGGGCEKRCSSPHLVPPRRATSELGIAGAHGPRLREAVLRANPRLALRFAFEATDVRARLRRRVELRRSRRPAHSRA